MELPRWYNLYWENHVKDDRGARIERKTVEVESPFLSNMDDYN